MANPIAEAFVRVRPDFSRFRAELEGGIFAEVGGAKAPLLPVLPNMATFRSELLAGLATLQIPPIEVPVVPVTAGAAGGAAAGAGAAAAQAASAATAQAGAAAQTASAGVQTLTAAVGRLNAAELTSAQVLKLNTAARGINAEINRAHAVALRELAAAARLEQSLLARSVRVQDALNRVQVAGVAAASEAAAAALRYSAAHSALGLAATLVRDALASENVVAIQNAEALFLSAEAAEAKALADLSGARAARTAAAEQARQTAIASRAAAVQAARLEQVSRGAATVGLTFLGLRGSVLAASGAFLAGAASLTALAGAIGAAARLETELNVFRVTAGATADEMERVGDAALQLGADVNLPGVTAGDAAQAMNQLAKAGLSVTDAMAGARGVLQLATAAEIDNAQAAELVANSLNAFNLAGTEAVHVADLLTNAANAAQGSIADFGVAMQQVAAVSNLVGVSLEDTTALLTLLAQNGLRGSDAGTSLRTAFVRLINPTSEARAQIQALGIEIRDAQGDIRPDVFAQFGEATEGLSPALRDAITALIFGQDAIRAVGIAADEGAVGLERAQDAMAETGSAAELAAARMAGLEGAAERLGNTLNTFGVKAGQKAIPFLTGLLDKANELAVGLGVVITKIDELGERPDTPEVGGGAEAEEASLGLTVLGVKLEDIQKQWGQFTLSTKEGLTVVAQAAALLPSAIIDIGQDAIRSAEDAEKLAQALQRVEDNRAEIGRLQLGEFAAEPAQQIQALSDQLLGALSSLAISTTGPIADQARIDVDEAIRELKRFGTEGAQALAAAGPAFVNAFRPSLQEAVESFSGVTDLFQDQIPRDLRILIQQFALTPAGRAELERTGNALTESLADGIEEGEQDGVAAARKAVQEAIRAGAEAVNESIRSARGNLESLAGNLASQMAEIIQAAPSAGIADIARQLGGLGVDIDVDPAIASLEDLSDAMDEFRDEQQRKSLRLGLRDAERELRDAREQLQTVGTVTPEQQRARDEFLGEFVEKAEDARARVQEFDISEQIEQQQDLKDALIETRTEGIQKLVSDFQAGKIQAGEFANRLKQQLAPALAGLPKANLGLQFNTAFLRNLNAVVAQAEALAGFLGRPGTEPGPQPVRPAETVAEAAARTRQAQANLTKQLNDITKTEKNTKDTADNTKRLIELIEKSVEAGRGGGKRTGAQAAGNPTVGESQKPARLR